MISRSRKIRDLSSIHFATLKPEKFSHFTRVNIVLKTQLLDAQKFNRYFTSSLQILSKIVENCIVPRVEINIVEDLCTAALVSKRFKLQDLRNFTVFYSSCQCSKNILVFNLMYLADFMTVIRKS